MLAIANYVKIVNESYGYFIIIQQPADFCRKIVRYAQKD